MGQEHDTHDEEATQRHWWLSVSLVVLGLILVAALYVLSIGPVAWLYQKNDWDNDYLETVYAPVIWLHRETALREPLEWYLDLFRLR